MGYKKDYFDRKFADIAAMIGDLKSEILKGETQMAEDFTTLSANLAQLDAVTAQLVTFINGLNAKIAALTPDQASIDKFADDVAGDVATINTAIAPVAAAAPATAAAASS